MPYGNILDMFGGGNPALGAYNAAQMPAGQEQPLGGGGGFMDTIGQNRMGLIGLGLGLMQGTPANRFGPALQGFQSGAAQDERVRQNAIETQLARQRMAESSAARSQ